MLFTKKVFITSITLLIFAFTSYCQNFSGFGAIPSKHFGINDFESAPQIWVGTQGVDGTCFFGNGLDLLAFNGNEWSKIQIDTAKTKKSYQDIADKSYVGCIKSLSDGKIAIGRENNFGFLDYSKSGKLTYYPVFATENTDKLGVIWGIYELGNGSILFIGESGIYSVNNKKVTRIEQESKWKEYEHKTSTRIGKGVLIVYQHKYLLGADGKKERKHQFLDLITGKMSEVKLPESCNIRSVRGSFQENGLWYVVDVDINGVNQIIQYNDLLKKPIWTKISTDKFPVFKNGTCYSVSQFGQILLVSTDGEGLYVAYSNGKTIRQYKDESEIDNPSVRFAFLDKNRNIWCGLERGIQFIETNSPITSFGRSSGINSHIETIDFKSGVPLIGNHQDLFISSKVDGRNLFSSIETFFQNIFDIRTFKTSQGKKTLIVGNDGVYQIKTVNKNQIPDKISGEYGWQLCQSTVNKDEIYFALEQGLGVFKLKENGTWEYKVVISLTGGETNTLVALKDKLYLPVKGIGFYMYDLNKKTYKLYKFSTLLAKKLALKSIKTSRPCIEVFQGKIIIGTYKGLYQFDDKKEKLVPFHSVFMNGDLDKTEYGIHRIKNIDNRQLWVVYTSKNSRGKLDKITGWFEQTSAGMKWITDPVSLLKVQGLPYAIEKNPLTNEVWIGTDDGLYILNQNAVGRKQNNSKVYIDRLEFYGQVRYNNLSHVKQNGTINYKDNTFRYQFYSNCYSASGPTLYSYKLEGYSDVWSEWSALSYADFVKISEGEYTLKVKVKSFYGQESEVESFKFNVSPPWYRTIWAYIIYLLIVGLIVFLAIQISTLRVKRQKRKLEEIVVERTSEIAEQNKQLEHQKSEITQKTTDILDSIHYAKRIQNTILPTDFRLKELFDEHFVFYRPKDIVSGDFYWAREVNGKILFASIDCTGHGVPGALVSFVGNNGLLRCISELRLSEPAEILDNLRDIVVKAFKTEANFDVKDGMDMAICSLDPKTGELNYAGAYNDCIIVRNGELIELKPDKQPIGLFDNAKPFTQHRFMLQENDCIYMTTDGYVDQFGGEKQKKFKAKPFKEMLSVIYQKPMDEQFIIIAKTFDDWKGDIDQVDDVCVVAVKYKAQSNE